ncbi:MAG TPA: hypothetical protein VMH04_04785 [Candidatus Solibacter sp.]|nr:hypothetical protein [Candidatus Solibacter sp.]
MLRLRREDRFALLAASLRMTRERNLRARGCRVGSSDQFILPIEHAPGPRGSPQEPQAPEGVADVDEPFADTAKTESCGSSFVVWHFGHSAFSLP